MNITGLRKKPFILAVNLAALAGTLADKDPTRTIMLRRQFSAAMTRRFRALKGDIRRTIIENDALGLARSPKVLAAAPPGAFIYTRTTDKVDAFMKWLRAQEETGILELTYVPGATGAAPWSNTYIRSAYQRGMVEARNKLRAGGADIAAFGSTGETLSAVFNRPFHADRVGLIYTRAYNELKGITEAMDQQISRELAKGLAEGTGPYEMARRINNRVDAIGINRARLLARTEVVQSLNTAALNEFEAAEAVIGEEVLVQWHTAQDERVRGAHRARHGRVYKKEHARALIGEPNCRCALLPYIESIQGAVEGLGPAGGTLPDPRIAAAIDRVKGAPGVDILGRPVTGGRRMVSPFGMAADNVIDDLHGVLNNTNIKPTKELLDLGKVKLIGTQPAALKSGVINYIERGHFTTSFFGGGPIRIAVYKGKRYIMDGHSRLIAAQLLGLTEVPVEVYKTAIKKVVKKTAARGFKYTPAKTMEELSAKRKIHFKTAAWERTLSEEQTLKGFNTVYEQTEYLKARGFLPNTKYGLVELTKKGNARYNGSMTWTHHGGPTDSIMNINIKHLDDFVFGVKERHLALLRLQRPGALIRANTIGSNSLVATVRHEWGHAVFFSNRFLPARLRVAYNNWVALYKSLGGKKSETIIKNISRYAASDPDEFFCEVYVMFTSPYFKAGTLDAVLGRGTEDLMRTIINNAKELAGA
jgi:SPP1 gp7 family putative phage head morphogenesis protein